MLRDIHRLRKVSAETLEIRSALYCCRSILTRLSQISDAPTGHMTHEPHQPRTGRSQIPAGVRQGATIERLKKAPSKQFSLWAHYSHRMQKAAQSEDAGMLIKLAACATRDYEIHTGKRRPSQHSDHEAAVDELLRDYQGVSSLEAAWMLNQSEKWVRRQRVLNGRDADQGLELRADETTLRVLRLSAAGASERMIAAELGLSKSAVHRRLESSMTEA